MINIGKKLKDWITQKKKKDLVLQLLLEEEPLYGLDLVKRSNGKLKRGLIYLLLNKMEEEGLIYSIIGAYTGRRFYYRADFRRKTEG